MTCDVLVLGAGVAGAAAAVFLGARGLKVILVDRGEPVALPCPDWLPRAGLELLEKTPLECTGCVGEPLNGVTFHSADLKRCAEAAEETPPAFRVDYAELVKRLRAKASAVGARLAVHQAIDAPDLREREVCVRLPELGLVRAAFAVVAGGCCIQTGCGEPPVRHLAEVHIPGGRRADGHMHWLLGAGPDELAAWWTVGRQIVVQLHAPGDSAHVAARLQALVVRLQAQDLLPRAAGVASVTVRTRPTAPRLALDLDSHVGKRSLTIGEAGGFLAASSRDGIYAALWSAQLAAEVIEGALKSRQPQDELREFSSLWRSRMGSYLSPPNAQVDFLLPLIFVNRQMAARLATAFWRGETL